MPSVPTISTILGTIAVAAVVITVLVTLLSVVTGRVERRQAATATTHRAVTHRPNEEDAGDLTADELAGNPVAPAPATATVPGPRVDVPAAQPSQEREPAHTR